MVKWKPACGALLLLVIAVHAQKESDHDVTNEVDVERPWVDIPTPHLFTKGVPQERHGKGKGGFVLTGWFTIFWATFKILSVYSTTTE